MEKKCWISSFSRFSLSWILDREDETSTRVSAFLYLEWCGSPPRQNNPDALNLIRQRRLIFFNFCKERRTCGESGWELRNICRNRSRNKESRIWKLFFIYSETIVRREWMGKMDFPLIVRMRERETWFIELIDWLIGKVLIQIENMCMNVVPQLSIEMNESSSIILISYNKETLNCSSGRPAATWAHWTPTRQLTTYLCMWLIKWI